MLPLDAVPVGVALAVHRIGGLVIRTLARCANDVLVLCDEAHVGIALFLAAILFIVSASKFRKSLYFALILFVVINAAMTLPGVYSLSRDPDFSDQKIFSLSAEKNIFVFCSYIF